MTFLEANQSKQPRLSYRVDWALADWPVKETQDVQGSNPYAQGWSEPFRKSILDWYDQSRVLSPEKSEKKRKNDDEERGEMDVQ
ncbi:hypothetical protein NC651_005542 [Populus alba x Populus x berolinensis]|nr:hypothetical protein NC651_005542 [Populus alba x Populus x berolinensis]